jgi:hypothetical protein
MKLNTRQFKKQKLPHSSIPFFDLDFNNPIILITKLHTNQAGLVKVHELICNYYEIINLTFFLNETFKSTATFSFRDNYVRLKRAITSNAQNP